MTIIYIDDPAVGGPDWLRDKGQTATVEQFHLKGTAQDHDQSSHAGGVEQFHANHDQSTHGNWAGGTRRRPPWFDPTAVDPEDLVEAVGEGDDGTYDAVYDYTVGGHETMNRALRGLAEPTDADLDLAERMSAAIDRSAGLSRDVTLYRGLDVELMAEVGDIVEDPAFVSTSADEYAAAMFGDFMMEIHVPKGTKGVLGEESLSEVILPRGLRFRLDDDNGYYVMSVVS